MSETPNSRRLVLTALIALTLHLLIGAASEATVVADFTWSPEEPMAGQEIQFTDTSTGGPRNWQWDFDSDGSVDSAEQNPTHSFAAPGTYPVTMLAAIPFLGADEITLDVVVTGGGPGSLSFTMSSYEVDEDAGIAEIAVQRLGGSAGEVSVRCDTSDGSATAPDDYAATMQTLTWSNGDSTIEICSVPIVDDGDVEDNETVLLTLTNFTGGAGQGSPAVADLTILDSGPPGTLQCSPGIDSKADVPADLLMLPGFEVDTTDPNGRTTFVSVYNQTNEPRVARMQYFDSASNLLLSEDVSLNPHDTQPTNIRDVEGLTVDADGRARGWVQILACSDDGGDLDSSFTGDYFFLDSDGNFATGDQLLRREDVCDTLQARLLNFGSGVTLRLFASDPQGELEPTASFSVYDEAGTLLDDGMLFIDQAIEALDATELTEVQFGVLVIDFLTGGGAMSVEYSAFGRFSVSMNANCVQPTSE